MGRAILTGLRYAARSKPLKTTLVRAVCFFFFASSYWAALPLVAREQLHGGPLAYSLLLALVGTGAVAGAVLLPRWRGALGPDRLVIAGSLGTGLAMALFAAGAYVAVVAGALLAGASWIMVLSTLNVSAQSSLPDWVRARGLALFITVFSVRCPQAPLLGGSWPDALGFPVRSSPRRSCWFSSLSGRLASGFRETCWT